MQILNLSLKNIGTFIEGNLDFTTDGENYAPVTIITGENGTGKTLILDAIRGMFYGAGQSIERNIVRDETAFNITMTIKKDSEKINAICKQTDNKQFQVNSTNNLFHKINIALSPYNGTIQKSNNHYVLSYWTSKLSNDSFEITSPKPYNAEKYLVNALSGVHSNQDLTNTICFFDNLRKSEEPNEKQLGEAIFEILKQIVKACLLNGEFKYVKQKTYTPIISQNGLEVSLDKLSSGNLYLIQRLVSLLGQMYAVHELNKTPLSDICKTEGILLIDEAENHLHPKWQKNFLNTILDIFPNLQIIATTHSPFIVGSVANARVYVCQAQTDHSIIVDKTAEYSNSPIDEILISEVFDTQPFNAEITNLMKERKEAIITHNKTKRTEIEQKLQALNPQYFSYFEIDELLEKITKS